MKRPKMPRGVRRRVYERDNYACRRCGWGIAPPAGYRGINALVVQVGEKRVVVRAPFSFRDDAPGDTYKMVPVYRALEIDHIVPLSKGGAFKDLENLQTLCSVCNNTKGVGV